MVAQVEADHLAQKSRRYPPVCFLNCRNLPEVKIDSAGKSALSRQLGDAPRFRSRRRYRLLAEERLTSFQGCDCDTWVVGSRCAAVDNRDVGMVEQFGKIGSHQHVAKLTSSALG